MSLANTKIKYPFPTETNLIDRLNNCGYDTSKIRTLDGEGLQIELNNLFQKSNTDLIFIRGKI